MAISFKYGGINAVDVGLKVQDIRRNIMPPISPRTVPIPGRAGNQFFKADLEMRTIDLDVFIIGATFEDAQVQVRAIADFLDPSEGLKELIFDDEIDKKYDAIISGNTNLSQILKLKRGTITFLVPNAFAIQIAEETINFNVMEFSRGSIGAYQTGPDTAVGTILDFNGGGHNPSFNILTDTNIADIEGDVPRYVDDDLAILPDRETVVVEVGTTNLVTKNASVGDIVSDYVAVGSSLLASLGNGVVQSANFNPQAAGTTVTLDGLAVNEGLHHRVNGIAQSASHTFSACTNTGGNFQLRLKVEQYNVGDVLLITNTGVAFTNSSYARENITFTSEATVSYVLLFIETVAIVNDSFLTSGWQLEQRSSMTNWHPGVGVTGGNTRNNELMPVRAEGMLNGTAGTIQIVFSPYMEPDAFGALFDWGQFSGINDQDRISILHGGSVGTAKRTVQCQITNGSTTDTLFISRTFTNQTVQFQRYYVSLRWNLTGNIGTGFVKLDIHDFTNDETLTNTVATAIDPISFASFAKMNIGHNEGGGNWENCMFENIRFDTTDLTDSEISTFITNLKGGNDEALKVAVAGAIRYTFDLSMMPTLFIPKGNVTQVGKFLFNNFDTGAPDIDGFKFFNEDSQEFIFYNPTPLLGTDDGELKFDFEKNTLENWQFGDVDNFVVIMQDLTFDSIFFPLPHNTELRFFTTFNNDVSLEAFREIALTKNTFVYNPRFL